MGSALALRLPRLSCAPALQRPELKEGKRSSTQRLHRLCEILPMADTLRNSGVVQLLRGAPRKHMIVKSKRAFRTYACASVVNDQSKSTQLETWLRLCL